MTSKLVTQGIVYDIIRRVEKNLFIVDIEGQRAMITVKGPYVLEEYLGKDKAMDDNLDDKLNDAAPPEPPAPTMERLVEIESTLDQEENHEH